MPDGEANTEKCRDPDMELKGSNEPMERGPYVATSFEVLDITISEVHLLSASGLLRPICCIFCLNKFRWAIWLLETEKTSAQSHACDLITLTL